MNKLHFKQRERRTKGKTFKVLSLSALSLFFFLFLISFTSAETMGYGKEITTTTSSVNYSLVNVNNSNYLQGYTPTTLGNWLQSTFNWITNSVSTLTNFYSKTDINNFNASYLNTTNTSYVPYTGANQNVNLGANNLSVDTNVLFVDNNNNKVGMNTTTPQTFLHIGTNVSSVWGYADQTKQGMIIAPNVNWARFTVQGNAGAGFGLADIGAGVNLKNIEFVTDGGTTLIRSLNDASGVHENIIQMMHDTGFVGIGTTAPDARLHIDSSSNGTMTEGLIISNYGASTINTGSKLSFKAYDSTSNKDAIAQIRAAFTIVTGGSERGYLSFVLRNGNTDAEAMRILSTGNIGIGTTTPSTKLDVNGSILANGTINTTGDICSLGLGICLSNVSSGSSGTGSINGSGTANYIPMWNGTTSLNNSAIYQNGTNIGIGTTSPGGKLTIMNTVENTPGLQFSTTIGEYGIQGDMLFVGEADGYGGHISFGASSIFYDGANNPGSLTPNRVSNQPGIFRYSATPASSVSGFYFGTAPAGETSQPITWNMVIHQNGRVGIGTESPNARLHIDNSSSGTMTEGVIISNYGEPTANTGAKLSFKAYDDGYSEDAIAQIRTAFTTVTGGAERGYLSFALRNGDTDVETMRILSTGNIGIGTTNPLQKLHVNGSILANGTINATSGFGVNGKSGITGNYSMLNSSSIKCFMNFTGGILWGSNC